MALPHPLLLIIMQYQQNALVFTVQQWKAADEVLQVVPLKCKMSLLCKTLTAKSLL